MRRNTPIQQLAALAALPLTETATVQRGRLTWQGLFKPTAVSITYRVRLDHVQPAPPTITVVSPALEVPAGRRLPHVYAGEALCLCYPWQWNDSRLIARTLVPWISEWLLHYELWKITDNWHGGGHEPVR